ncbi:MAG: glycosyltransferase [Syntrophobacteraceae bacterium]|jgi:hypothetical protein
MNAAASNLFRRFSPVSFSKIGCAWAEKDPFRVKTTLKILITNNTLAARAGTELYVRDLASALARQGHEVAVYSNVLGETAQEIDSLGVPVFSDLSQVHFRPDIIHGHHHLETITALLQFPDVPAVYFCHGIVPWEELPPIHPRIIQYAAIGVLTRRHCIEQGVPAHRIRIIHNFVDIDRFKPRRPLPVTPKRALVFSNQASKHNYLAAAGDACRRAGLELDVRGIASRAPVRSPETFIGSYDIVFARGRAALEALAVGTAVVLCDKEGAGPMVDSSSFDALRLRNFGCTTLGLMPSAEVLLDQINRYDAGDALRVSNRVRSEASLTRTLSYIVDMYREAIAQFHDSRSEPLEESVAVARYVRWMSDLIKANKLIRKHGYKWCGPARLPGQPQAGMLREPVVRRALNFLGKLAGLKRHG